MKKKEEGEHWHEMEIEWNKKFSLCSHKVFLCAVKNVELPKTKECC